jgi:hypothetical protein
MMGELLVILVIAVIVFGPIFLRSRQRVSGDDSSPPPWHADLGWRPESLTRNQLVLAVLAGGVVANALDLAVHGYWLGTEYYARLPEVFRSDGSPGLLVVTDFVAAAVFVWVYDRVRPSFPAGVRGGATFGLYAGLLVGFPTHIFLNLVIVDFPYAVAWAWTANQVVWGVSVGAVVGGIVGKRD